MAANPMVDVRVLFERAVAAYRHGEAEHAAAACAEILARAPDHLDAGHLLAILAFQSGRTEEGIGLIRRVITLAPDHAPARLTLGTALLSLRRLSQALQEFERGCRLLPGDPECEFGRGNALLALGRLPEAIGAFGRAIAANPGHVDALYNCANALLLAGRHEEALGHYHGVLQLAPAHLPALNNAGTALLNLRRPQEALACFDRALALRPDYARAHLGRGTVHLAQDRLEDALREFDAALGCDGALTEAHCNRAVTLRDLGRPADALASVEQALRLEPANTGALNTRGNALLDLGRTAEALESFEQALRLAAGDARLLLGRGCTWMALREPARALADFERAVALEPQLIAAHTNRGAALVALGRTAEALASFERALALDADGALAAGPGGSSAPDRRSLGRAALLDDRANALVRLERFGEAAGCFEQLLGIDPQFPHALGNLVSCRQACCDWERQDEGVERVLAALGRGQRAVHPFALLSMSDSPAAQLECARLYAGAELPRDRPPLWRGERYRHARIRVGYLSADLRDHAVSYLMAGVFAGHDRAAFETWGISLRADDGSAMGRRVRESLEHFVDLSGHGDDDAARWIREQEIDILVDLNGYTSGGRSGILAYRPAPVQLSYLGLPATMGTAHVDYILADLFVIPPHSRGHYAEQVACLPHCYQANDRARTIGPRPVRSEAGLPGEALVLACFNGCPKLSPVLFDVWCELLRAAPGSVLWLLAGQEEAREHLRREASRRGVDAGRVVFASGLPYQSHLARLQLADLCLDTLPFNAGTSASDALWAGVPLLTCAGDAFAARMAGSLLGALELPELVTFSLGEYRERALELVREPERLAQLRARLAANRRTHAPFDTPRFCRDLESAYRHMWRRSQEGAPPRSFSVEPLRR